MLFLDVSVVLPKSCSKGQPRSTKNEFPIRADFGNSRNHGIWRPKRGENWQPKEPFYRQRNVILRSNEVCVYCDFWRALSPVIVSNPFINVLSLTAVLSTLPDNPGDSKFWTVSPGLQIRVWYLPDNRQNCYFLDSRLSDHKISNTLRCLSYCGNVFP